MDLQSTTVGAKYMQRFFFVKLLGRCKLEVSFVLPLSQQEQQEEPNQKCTRRMLNTGLKFCTLTLPLMEDNL